MSLVRVALFGLPDRTRLDELQVEAFPNEASGFDVEVFDDDRNLSVKLAQARPHVVVTFGDVGWYQELGNAPMWVRKRWLHIDDADAPLGAVASSVMHTYVLNAVTNRFPDVPFISVFTCAYRSGERLHRA